MNSVTRARWSVNRLNFIQPVPSKLLTQVRWESRVPSENLAIPEKKPRKTYKVMRKVNPTEDILSPEQWKHMRHQTMIQHTRWNLQGGWKKKLMTGLIILSAVGYIYYYTILKMSRDSFYAELEYAENMERLRKGKTAPDYNMKDIDDETDD